MVGDILVVHDALKLGVRHFGHLVLELDGLPVFAEFVLEILMRFCFFSIQNKNLFYSLFIYSRLRPIM